MLGIEAEAPSSGWLPLETWMHRDRITPSALLRAERAGAHLPVVEFRGEMLVVLDRLYDWRELAALLVRAG
jgi:hypothetical protein